MLLKVPNESLYDEVMNNLTDIRKRLGELSGVRIPVDFEVVIEASREGSSRSRSRTVCVISRKRIR